MMRTSGADTKEYYTGKLSFYIYKKSTRNPLFLQRNLRRVLDSHRKDLARQRQRKQKMMKADVPATNGLGSAAIANSRNWSTKEIIHILERKSFSNRDPVLRIDATAIRDRFAKYRDAKDNEEPPKKSAKISPVEATCSLTIWDSTSGTFDTVVEQTRKCEIFQRNKPSGERYASIELSEPFIVPLRKLQPKRERASQTYGEQLFSMQLALMAANSTDRWPPVETRIPAPKTADFLDPTGHLVRFPVLVAKWLRLPKVPENQAESLLELFASQDQGKYKPKLSLKIDAQWLEPPTPLTAYNSEYRNGLVSPETSSRSTSTQDQNVPRTVVKTEWIFEGLVSFMDRLTFDGYICSLCNGQQFRDANEFHFHLVNGHDLFKFAFSQKFETNGLNQSVAEGLVRVELGDTVQRKLTGKNPHDFREMSWFRPDRPFELEKYLLGDESWLGNPNRRSSLLVPPPQLERSSSREVTKDVPVSAITRPPDQVPDLESPARKKFKVPPAPSGMRFYRTTAKCPLEEGDMVSESDDDIDEEWLLEKHSDTIDSFTDTLPQEKEFMQIYDRHMLQEDVSSDLHAGEALIRFCRANKAWLQRPSMRLEFSKKAAALKLQGALNSTVIRACLAIINSPMPTDLGNNDAMDIDSPTRLPSQKPQPVGNSTLENSSKKPHETYRPLTPPEVGHIYGRCAKCNSAILDMRKNIRCANPLCSKPDHHLLCIGLLERDSEWTCEECKNAGFLPEPKIKPTKTVGSTSAAVTSETVQAAASPSVPLSPPASTSALASSLPSTAPGNETKNKLPIRSRDSSPTQETSTDRHHLPDKTVDEEFRSAVETGPDETDALAAPEAVNDTEKVLDDVDVQDAKIPANDVEVQEFPPDSPKNSAEEAKGSVEHDMPESPGSASTNTSDTKNKKTDGEEEDEEDVEAASEAQDASDEDYKESEIGEAEEDADMAMD